MGATHIPWLLHFTLDPYPIVLSDKQGIEKVSSYKNGFKSYM